MEEHEQRVRMDQLTAVTQMLCYVVTRARQGHAWAEIERDNWALAKWIQNHDREDRARIEQEAATQKAKAARAAAIAKLTPAERAALGLNETF
jgi:hypothetical protein